MSTSTKKKQNKKSQNIKMFFFNNIRPLAPHNETRKFQILQTRPKIRTKLATQTDKFSAIYPPSRPTAIFANTLPLIKCSLFQTNAQGASLARIRNLSSHLKLSSEIALETLTLKNILQTSWLRENININSI